MNRDVMAVGALALAALLLALYLVGERSGRRRMLRRRLLALAADADRALGSEPDPAAEVP